MRIADRVAVVTGGSSGIGFGIVQRLLGDGARVAFCGTRPESISVALGKLAGLGVVIGEAADVADPMAVKRMFDAVRRRWGRIDILVNNAGISPKRRTQQPWISQIDLDAWRRVLDVNLTGAWLCTREACPGMIAQRWGRVINIGSIAGRTMPEISGPHYAAAKAGLGALTRALAGDLAAHGITVNCIAPGWIASGMTAPADSATAQEAATKIPIGRVGEPPDVAAAVAFLVSEEASYVTGATIDVNGGAFMA